MSVRKPLALTGIVLAALLSINAIAFQRFVIVNGFPVGPADLAVLDYLHGEYIPNGRYWLDLNTGAWGFEGGPLQGYLGDGYGGGETTSNRCGGHFEYDCVKANFCEENPSICSPVLGN